MSESPPLPDPLDPDGVPPPPPPSSLGLADPGADGPGGTAVADDGRVAVLVAVALPGIDGVAVADAEPVVPGPPVSGGRDDGRPVGSDGGANDDVVGSEV